VRYFGVPPGKEAELEERRDRGRQALAVMDRHLQRRPFFVGDRYTIADIALYAYTHVAEDGGLSLTDLPALGQWLDRVRDQPRHIAIDVR
jgi:glutathione S-transferase